MNIVQAIAAHAAWKRRLRRMITGHEPCVSSDAVWHDDRCELGAWMHGDGQRLIGCDAFDEAFSSHVEFHRCAGDVVSAVEQGDRLRAEALMAAGSAFERASAAIERNLGVLADELVRSARAG